MKKICVFAGTSEGRRLVEFLSNKEAKILACVATDYGEALLDDAKNLEISAKRMNADEMEALFSNRKFDLVIDATHPYASIVTENVMLACSRTGTEYLRLIRDGAKDGGAECFASVEDAAAYLNGTEGNILLTTGSKELAEFSRLDAFAERVYARVLPMEDSLSLCRCAGLAPSHIIAMQGPFSVGMNAATIRAVNAAFVVTKQSGKAGGFDEKALAAKRTGAKLIVIGRPEERSSGLSYSDTLKYLEKRFGFSTMQKVVVCGIGMGGASLTLAAEEAIRSAECVVGAKRMLECAAPNQTVFEAVAPDAIAEYIRTHNEFTRFAVLMSGDVGFFSGAKKLLPKLDFCGVTVISGVSSLSYLCSKCGVSYEDTVSVSLHGREENLIPTVKRNRSVFALVGGENGTERLINELVEAGLPGVRVTVGEKLGYPDERLTIGTAGELAGMHFDPLSAVLIQNEAPESSAAGLPDTAFLRNAEDKPVVPMTKSEVRAVVMSKLRLLDDSVCWDIGAGTGSVSIELALEVKRGSVYAIEKKPEAAELLRENIAAFGVKNIELIEGTAPEACKDLPSPTHAFIGGSSGNMRAVVELLLEKNPRVRIVAAAVSLETVSELARAMKEFAFTDTEVVCLNVSKAKRLGGYELMLAQNPVYIFTMQKS